MIFHLPKYKKRIVSAVLCSSLMLSAGAPVFAFDENTITSSVFEEVQTKESAQVVQNAMSLANSGYALKSLGLIVGDTSGDLMLDKVGTRQEAFTIFLALLGEQEAATQGKYSYTFRDVSAWFSNFAGYGVYKHYTSGYSETTFGANDAVTPAQYMSFVLRALGYEYSTDFKWSESLNKAVEIGLCTQSQAESWTKNAFRRQEIMEMSYLALNTKMKNSNCTLTDKLIAVGRITPEAATAENLTFGTTYTVAQTVNGSAGTIAHSALPSGSYELHNVGTKLIMTANSAAKQANIGLASDTNSAAQQFTIQNNSDGSFQLLCKSNTSLAVDANPTDGAEVILWNVNSTECQTFIAVEEANGVYSIRLASNTSVALTAESNNVRLKGYSGASSQQWKLSDNSEDTAAASAKLASIMTVYPSGKSLGSSYSFAGASQCMGFGREVFYRMYGQTARWSYDGSPKSSSDGKLYTITAKSSSYSSSSIKSLISKAKPGDILQMNSPKMHTMVFVSSDSTGFTVYDANWTGPNKVSVRHVSYGAWAGRNSSGITVLHATNYPTT
ncbi:MAG: RICIN domain-containing protein [Clostridia bacterium]|nr:RICIN domain-containing protein [Clostridia bacterium]